MEWFCVIFSDYSLVFVRVECCLRIYICCVYWQCVDKVEATVVGCYLFSVCVSIFLYAYDILLIAPSVNALQTILSACEHELMRINEKKSKCIRFGPRHNAERATLSSDQGGVLYWSWGRWKGENGKGENGKCGTKWQGWKWRERKTRHQSAGVEIVRTEKSGNKEP